MAARSRKLSLTDGWKAKIRASMLVNRLQNHVAGRIEMSNSQVRAAQVLLSKVVPDLARTEVTGEDGGPIQTENKLEIGFMGQEK
mgnify:CR=1 FL=1